MHFSTQENELRAFRKALLSWYRTHKRDLPWRRTTDPYAIWISEVMLQQTRVDTVIPYYQAFMEKYPDLDALAQAEPESLLKSWEGLGYYQRLFNLQKTAQRLRQQGLSRLPEDPENLRQLPGVGPYIAAAVASIAFHVQVAVVDGNVKRVMARLFSDPFPVNAGTAHRHYLRHASLLLDPKNPKDANQAVMELGATCCSPAKPKCADCPVSLFCEAWAQKKTELYPLREKKRPSPFFSVACAAIVDENFRILVTKRPETGMLPGFWEFPGGKCEQGESEERACIREVREETGLILEKPEKLCTIGHAYTHFRIAMTLFGCRTREKIPALLSQREHRWIFPDELQTLAFPAANRKCMPALHSWLQRYA